MARPWVVYYFRFRARLAESKIGAFNYAHMRDKEEPRWFSIGSGSWEDMPPDKWPQAERIIREAVTKLRALLKEDDDELRNA